MSTRGIIPVPAQSAHGLTETTFTHRVAAASLQTPPGAPRTALQEAPYKVGTRQKPSLGRRTQSTCPPTRRTRQPSTGILPFFQKSPLPHFPSNTLTCVSAQFPPRATRSGTDYVHARARSLAPLAPFGSRCPQSACPHKRGGATTLGAQFPPRPPAPRGRALGTSRAQPSPPPHQRSRPAPARTRLGRSPGHILHGAAAARKT
jgi:hypothetical protein